MAHLAGSIADPARLLAGCPIAGLPWFPTACSCIRCQALPPAALLAAGRCGSSGRPQHPTGTRCSKYSTAQCFASVPCTQLSSAEKTLPAAVVAAAVQYSSAARRSALHTCS